MLFRSEATFARCVVLQLSLFTGSLSAQPHAAHRVELGRRHQPAASGHTRTLPLLRINEVVTDPQQDWDDSAGGNGSPFDAVPGNGAISATDEWVELFNAGDTPVDLTESSGWTIEFVDTTPEILNFANPGSAVRLVFSQGGNPSFFQSGEYLVIGNPPGNLNNDVYLILKNSGGEIVDDVELGDDAEGDGAGDGAPDGGAGGGDATSAADEAIARLPNGHDTDDDVADFVQQPATIGATNAGEVCVTFDFPVSGGAWYLISLPVIPAATQVSALFPTAVTAFEWVYAAQSYQLADTLAPAKAYWLLMAEPATVEVCGQALETYTKSYAATGWDLIGATLQPAPVTDAPAGSIAAMFGWQAAGQSYEMIDPLQAEPTHGYWILVSQAPSSVTVGPAGGGSARRSSRN